MSINQDHRHRQQSLCVLEAGDLFYLTNMCVCAYMLFPLSLLYIFPKEAWVIIEAKRMLHLPKELNSIYKKKTFDRN